MITPKFIKCKAIKPDGNKCEKEVYYLPQLVPGTDNAGFIFNDSGQVDKADPFQGLDPKILESKEIVEIYLTCEDNHTFKYLLARDTGYIG